MYGNNTVTFSAAVRTDPEQIAKIRLHDKIPDIPAACPGQYHPFRT